MTSVQDRLAIIEAKLAAARAKYQRLANNAEVAQLKADRQAEACVKLVEQRLRLKNKEVVG